MGVDMTWPLRTTILCAPPGARGRSRHPVDSTASRIKFDPIFRILNFFLISSLDSNNSVSVFGTSDPFGRIQRGNTSIPEARPATLGTRRTRD